MPLRAIGLILCQTMKAQLMKSVHDLNDAQVSDIVQMALSDHVAFADIEHQYGLKEKEVVALMRNTLRTGSYRAWRKRVATFGRRREHYK